MDARDMTPETVDELVLRWRAMRVGRDAGPRRCSCGCKCAPDVTMTQPTLPDTRGRLLERL